MRTIGTFILGSTLILFAICAALPAHANPQITAQQLAAMTPLDPAAVPKFGNFWLWKGPNGTGQGMPPLPCPPGDMPGVPIYALGDNHFLVDDSQVDYNALRQQAENGALTAEDDSGGQILDTHSLWLEITNVSNGFALANLHNATNQVYAIWSTTDLLTGWNVETDVWPTNQAVMPFIVPTFDRQTLFLRAMDWTGVTENGNTVPNWWFWENFGTTALSDTDLDGQGNTLLNDYIYGIDPNRISFTVHAGYGHFGSPQVTAQFEVLAGTPSYSAVLVNSATRTNVVWVPYTGSASFSLGPTDGVYSVQFGLKGRAPQSTERWIGTSVALDRVPPTVFLTSPSTTNVIQPSISVCGYSTEPLGCVTYCLSNAFGWTPPAFGTLLGLACAPTNYFEVSDLLLSEGPNLISLSLSDIAGNVTTTNLTCLFDRSSQTNPPALQIFWPLDGAHLGADTFNLRGQVNDPAVALIAQLCTIDTTNYYNGLVGSDGRFWVAALPAADGTNWLTITATTPEGNSSSTSLVLVKSDVHLGITDVLPEQSYMPTATVIGTISDNGYKVWVNGIATLPSGGSWTVQHVPLPADGSTVVTTTAIPLADNEGNGTPGQSNTNDPAPPNPSSTNSVSSDFSAKATDARIKLIKGEWRDASEGVNADWGWYADDFHWTFSETNGGFATFYEKLGFSDPSDSITSVQYRVDPNGNQNSTNWWLVHGTDGSEYGSTNFTSGLPWEGWPFLGWSINGPMALGSLSGPYDDGGVLHGEASISAKDVTVVLRTGGQPNSARWTLFEIGGTATEVYRDEFGAFVQRTNNISPEEIFIPCLGTNLEANGLRYGVLQDNKEEDITFKASVPYYKFNPTAERLEVPLTLRVSERVTQRETNNVGYQTNCYDLFTNLTGSTTLAACRT